MDDVQLAIEQGLVARGLPITQEEEAMQDCLMAVMVTRRHPSAPEESGAARMERLWGSIDSFIGEEGGTLKAVWLEEDECNDHEIAVQIVWLPPPQ